MGLGTHSGAPKAHIYGPNSSLNFKLEGAGLRTLHSSSIVL